MDIDFENKRIANLEDMGYADEAAQARKEFNTFLASTEGKIAATARSIAATAAKIEELTEAQRLNTMELRKLRARLADEQRASQLVNSPKARWDRAVKSLRKDGVHFRTNMMKCCRGCITEEDLNMKDAMQPYGYTFGGQDSWVKFNEDGYPYEKASRSSNYDYQSPEKVFINWGNGAADRIVEAFDAEGFKIDFDGSECSCIEIFF